MPRGIDETIPERWDRPLKYDLTEHAERNAIYNAARHGTPLNNSICIVSMFPCCDCARAIIQIGCKMVVSYDWNDNECSSRVNRWIEQWNKSMKLLKEANVHILLLKKHEIDNNNNN